MSLKLKDKRVVVVGLAKSGVAAARLCLAQGARVTAADRRDLTALGAPVRALEAQGATLALGPHEPRLFADADLVVVSPGVPLFLPALAHAREAGVPVVAEVELASWFLRSARLIGITGTNGKSTTTALAGHLCQTSGARVFAGGNLGQPLSEAVLAGGDFDYVACELSSFQLEGIRTLRPHVAVITNLTPDHLDRYPSHAAYGEAKRRIFLNQTAEDAAVVNAGDASVMALAQGACARTFTFGFGPPAARAARANGRVFFADLGEGPERYELRNRALRGDHNMENAMAAVLAARLAGVPCRAIQAGLDGFPGLPHRIESAGVVDGVEYVNDSKATNVESSLVALKAFPGNVWLIAGGRGKGAPYAPLADASRGRVQGVLTLGEDARAIEEAFSAAGIPVHSCGDLPGAVAAARRLARPGDVVLLSPACASYDQFSSFEQRGERFKALVRALQGGTA